MFKPCFAAVCLMAASVSAANAEAEVSYTKLDIEGVCQWDSLDHLSEEEKEQLLGNSAVCEGLPGYPVHFSDFDLRQTVAFGPVGPDERSPGGFNEFNNAGDTIEWRSNGGKPYAAILRWFISNVDGEGRPDEKLTGQVLVISTVAQPDNPYSCPAGYVDARANKDANALARKVADEIARGFRCGTDRPKYHGERGATAGNPVSIAE